jgi:hypothetical protein
MGKDIRKGCRRVNMKMLCTHVCKWKNETLKLFQEWEKGVKENEGGSEFNYDICKCHIVPSSITIIKIKKF